MACLSLYSFGQAARRNGRREGDKADILPRNEGQSRYPSKGPATLRLDLRYPRPFRLCSSFPREALPRIIFCPVLLLAGALCCSWGRRSLFHTGSLRTECGLTRSMGCPKHGLPEHCLPQETSHNRLDSITLPRLLSMRDVRLSLIIPLLSMIRCLGVP